MKFLRGILGIFGIIKKTSKFTTENNTEFLQSLSAGAVILYSSHKPDAIQRGIQAVTDSKYFHVSIYVGKTVGQFIRSTFPQLIENLSIPLEPQTHEIVEAHLQGGVRVSVLELDDTLQLTAYARVLSTVDLLKILYRAYEKVGTPYDLLECIGDAGIPLPNNPKRWVCSSSTADNFLPVERIVKKNAEIESATPRDIADYMASALSWKKTTWNN